MSDSVSGQTVVDPRGYLTSLENNNSINATTISDIDKARVMYRSMTQSNPTNPQGWIARARLEHQTGILLSLITVQVNLQRLGS
jgi:pre-mRNA-processing factor 6